MKDVKQTISICIIISFLLILGLPVISLTKWQVKRDICLSNLKKIGTAFILYTTDYDSKMPIFPTVKNEEGNLQLDPTFKHSYDEYPKESPAHTFNINTNIFGNLSQANHFISWADLFYPYVKDRNVFVCPMANQVSLGYGINANLYGTKDLCGSQMLLGDNSLNKLTINNIDSFTNQKETVLICDAPQNIHPYDKNTCATLIATSYYVMKVYDFKYNGQRHEGGANFLMLDGHAENIRNNTKALADNNHYETVYNDKGRKYWDPFI